MEEGFKFGEVEFGDGFGADTTFADGGDAEFVFGLFRDHAIFVARDDVNAESGFVGGEADVEPFAGAGFG